MSEDALKDILKDYGLTETESEIYLFLSRHKASKGTEIAKQTRKDKAQVYHILKNLQAKGLVEATLEVPVHFTPVPFENVVESAIQAKKDEAARIERTKQELLNYWKDTSKNSLDLPSEKFTVIQGQQKIYSKIAQMAAQTRNQLSIIATPPDLLKADRFNVYDAADKNTLKSKIQLRFLTEVSNENLRVVKNLLGEISKKGFNFKGKVPDLHQTRFPQMVIKDTDETLFFIEPNPSSPEPHEQICLWTNCRDLVRAFSGVFENIWLNSIDINRKMIEVETGKPHSEAFLISDHEATKRKYMDALVSAEKEIIAVTSEQGLISLSENEHLIETAHRGVKIKVMAPITTEDWSYSQKLMAFGEVRHIPVGYLETVIFDGKTVFEFKNCSSDFGTDFGAVFFSNDFAYAQTRIKMLNYLWDNLQLPSAVTLEAISRPNSIRELLPKTIQKMDHAQFINNPAGERKTEKDIIDSIIKAQKEPGANKFDGKVRTYGTNMQAIVHPPKEFNLPDLLFHVYHMEKHSTFGAEDVLLVHPWLETPSGYAYVVSALLTDNQETVGFWKKALANTPAQQNIHVVKPEELEVRIHGLTLFVGWTRQIQLTADCVLPPSCLIIEGYGNIKTMGYSVVIPSGYTLRTEANIFDAFVTFLHPTSKYSGPGTDGAFGREVMMEFIPP